MKHKSEYFFCSPRLLRNIDEIQEIYAAINSIKWEPTYSIEHGGKLYEHQSAYNKGFELEFSQYSWEVKPLLHDNPRLIGDFRKNVFFVEVQFGNSSTLYRDYYKFHYGLTHNLLSLSVLIVPTNPKEFFPTRPSSVVKR